jgi:DNA-binding MarR family transcriptional regulator
MNMQSIEMDTLLNVLKTARSSQLVLIERMELLLTIAKYEPVKQHPLGPMLSQPSATLSRYVEALVDTGLVTSGIDPADRRKRILTLSPEGERLVLTMASFLKVYRSVS